MAIERILLVEDDSVVLFNLKEFLSGKGFDVAGATTLASALERIAKESFDLIIADMRLPDGDATELLKILKNKPPSPPLIMMSGLATVEEALECIKAGAFDYLLKPISPPQLEIVVRKAEQFTQLVRTVHHLSIDVEEREIIGVSPLIQQLRQLIQRVAKTDATVLIQGESGTGKELVAHALHTQSHRAGGPFIKVNCAAIPDHLIESEFFGHEKGAFTGAINKREGRFELAHGGTILLDEISEISPSVQAKLLRVLQEKEFERVGGTRTIKVDVRVIATTNRNLEESVLKKEFRADLFFRLNVIPIYVPPLRERREDIILLAEYFMKRFSRKHGVKVFELSPESKRLLLDYHWPGNVRELQNVIERAVILCDGHIIEPEHLNISTHIGAKESPAVVIAENEKYTPPSKSEVHFPTSSPRTESTHTDDKDSPASLEEVMRQHILAVLKKFNWNRTKAAKALGISIRTLRNKLHEYRQQGILIPDSKEPLEEIEEELEQSHQDEKKS